MKNIGRDSPSLEDYLETIYFLSSDGMVRMTDISIRIGVSKASVSRALGILEERGYISHRRYGTISLTEAGIERATEISHRHELFKTFLTKLLCVDEENAENDACRMEHAVSAITVSKLEEFLKNFENKDRKSID